jgi:hypothetical protein
LAVVLPVSKNGRRLAVAAVGLDMTCTSGIRYSIEDDYSGVPIGVNSRFSASYALPPTTVTGNVVVGGSGAMTGRLDRRHTTLSGVWHIHQTFIPPNVQRDECDSGQVKFTAHR